MPYYERGLQLSRFLGNMRLTAYASMNYGAAILDVGRYREARVYVEEARDLYGLLEERDALALLEINRGEMEMGLGRWGAATRIWGSALQTLRLVGSEYDLLLALVPHPQTKFHI